MPKMSNRKHAIRFLIAVATLMGASLRIAAQDVVSQYDHGTPPQHAAGVSAIGSYISADLGTVNLSNGSLNFSIPVGQIGGRGFSLPLTINYRSKVWSARTFSVVVNDPTTHTEPVAIAVHDDAAQAEDIYYKLGPGWSVGAAPYIKVRGVGINPHDNPVTGCKDATDGSGAVFFSDNDNGVVNGDVAGRLFTPDGTLYRFVNAGGGNSAGSAYLNNLGRCTSVTDRNGNLIQISYPTSTRVQYTDQLGRLTTLDINDPALAPYVLQVTLPGYNGQNRIYKAKADTMNLHYRAGINPTLPVITGDWDPLGYGYEWPGPHTSLFALSYGSGAEQIDNRSVVTQLLLPDNRTLSFNYNEFGEVAEVQMPTGGKVQYDYQSVLLDSQPGTGLPTGNSLPCEVHPSAAQANSNVSAIDRAVVARRTYPDGSTLEGNWSYAFKIDKTEVQCRNISNTLLLDQWHYYLSSQRFLDCINGAPDGTGYSIWSTGIERRNERRDSNQTTVLAANEQDWAQRASVSWSTGYTSQQIANDNRVNEQRKYLDDGSSAKVHTFYDAAIAASNHVNNPSEVDEYDFDQTLKRYTTTSYLIGGHYTGTGTNTVNLLSLSTLQSVFDGPTGSELSRAEYEYDNYTPGDGNHDALVDNGAVTGHDSGYGTTKTERGNQTQVKRMVNASTFTYSYPRYDTLGNVISTKDPRGNVSTISYQDDFGVGAAPGSGSGGSNGATFALPTLITSPPPNPSEPAHTARSQYDFNTGLLTGFKDRNGTITQTIYNDAFDRPTQVKAALGLGLENHTAMYYAPQTNPFGITLTNNDVLSAKDQAAIDDGNLRSWTKTDGFGRTIESWTHAPDELYQGSPVSGDIVVKANYDGLGRTKQTSNPFRPAVLTETAQYTTTGYDLAGRVTTVTTPDNAVVTSAYDGPRVLVIDQAGMERLSKTDGAGRLTDVWEIRSTDTVTGTEPVTFPNHSEVQAGYRTKYSYDVLDDLVEAKQEIGTVGTTQTRTFVYDGLKRLTRAINPESGTIDYTYDLNSNLNTKLDARSITTTYNYDALNRVKDRTYTNDPQNTPAVFYSYDGQTLPTGAPSFAPGSSIGRLVSTTYGGASAGNYQGYDQLGRVNVSYQQTDSQNYGFTNYSYNIASEMTSETYPSGRVVVTDYDTAGRVAGVKNQTTGLYYAGATGSDATNRILYASHGAVSKMKLGNGKWEHTNFNNRLQPIEIGLGTSGTDSSLLRLDYGYGTTTTNNGNLISQNIVIGATTISQSYVYDSLNRLQSASENSGASWSQTYAYDRYGNRWVSASPGYTLNSLTPQLQGDFNATTNRIVLSQYDGAGNQIVDKQNRAFAYDAENRQTSFNGNGATGQYFYDGDGRRVKKIDSTGTTVFVYNVGGQLIAEYHGDPVPAPQGGGGHELFDKRSSRKHESGDEGRWECEGTL